VIRPFTCRADCGTLCRDQRPAAHSFWVEGYFEETQLAEPEEINAEWKRWSCTLLKPDGLYPTRPAARFDVGKALLDEDSHRDFLGERDRHTASVARLDDKSTAVELSTVRFYTQEGGYKAWVGVRESATGHKFLQTYADGVWKDNLLSLKECI
jgi:hypothetical protein